MRVIFDKGKQRVPIKTWCENPESGALEQAEMLANHPAICHWVSLMPDTHFGCGMPIGGVVCLEDAISPHMVGADIGCGMGAWETGVSLGAFQEKKIEILPQVRGGIPTGFNRRRADQVTTHSEEYVERLYMSHGDKKFWKRVSYDPMTTVREQLGTLGGGNHFLEFQKDQNDMMWVMVHSGSRNMGKVTGDIYHDLALSCNTKWRTALNVPDLAFLPFSSDEGQEYYEAMNFCLDFAFFNRQVMMDVIQEAFEMVGLPLKSKEFVNIHHNYASMETHFGKTVIVHRKGATFAGPNTVGIIPGSMGTQSYIVKGKGNTQSFHSCSHGAGRRMGRGVAKKTLTMDEFEKAMEGIDFRPSEATLDESPMAYKDISVVMKEQEDLIEILHELTPVLPIKDETPQRQRGKK